MTRRFMKVLMDAGRIALLLISLAFLLDRAVLGQGTVDFQNPSPIYLADCVTKAAGSNFVVELLASAAGEWKLIVQTNLLTGQRAGQFNGGVVGIPGSWGTPATLLIRVWDKSTGTNFDSAASRASVLLSVITGGHGAGVPTLPAWLAEFPSFCLGKSTCDTNCPSATVAFDSRVVYGRFTSGHAELTVTRTGFLSCTNEVAYATSDDSAIGHRDYAPQSGTLRFLPDEISKTIRIPLLDPAFGETRLAFRVNLRDPSDGVRLGLADATVWLQDDRPILRTFTTSGEISQQGVSVVFRASPTDWVLTIWTATNLLQRNWIPFRRVSPARPYVFYFGANPTLSQQFFRASVEPSE